MADRTVFDIYDEPGMEWWLRVSGPHLHGGAEAATIALAQRAAPLGLGSGRVVEIASALGAPSRVLARTFGCEVICIDMDVRMHRAARETHRREGLDLAIHPLVARTERLPLKDASCDGAWSQDAMCHMDKEAVIAEVARVIERNCIFAFSDFIARKRITPEGRESLKAAWAFPTLYTIPDYVHALDAHGFEVLYAEERTSANAEAQAWRRPDEAKWRERYAARWGEEMAARQEATTNAWSRLVERAQVGYGMFIARNIEGTERERPEWGAAISVGRT